VYLWVERTPVGLARPESPHPRGWREFPRHGRATPEGAPRGRPALPAEGHSSRTERAPLGDVALDIVVRHVRSLSAVQRHALVPDAVPLDEHGAGARPRAHLWPGRGRCADQVVASGEPGERLRTATDTRVPPTRRLLARARQGRACLSPNARAAAPRGLKTSTRLSPKTLGPRAAGAPARRADVAGKTHERLLEHVAARRGRRAWTPPWAMLSADRPRPPHGPSLQRSPGMTHLYSREEDQAQNTMTTTGLYCVFHAISITHSTACRSPPEVSVRG
jgi:hypothetical protein